MPVRTKATTLRLPHSLLEKLGESAGNDDRARTGRPPKSHMSRRESRKLERAQLKQRKATFFSAAPSASKESKRQAEDEHAESPKRKKVRSAESTSVRPESLPVSEPVSSSPLKPKHKPKKTSKDGIHHTRKSSGSLHLSSKGQREQDEDAYMSYLEAKLGYKPGKKTSVGDGLDDLLDLATSLMVQPQQESERDETSESDEQDSEAEEWHGIDHTSVEDNTSQPQSNTFTASTRYVPPQLRDRPSVDDPKNSEHLVKLQRQLKGLLNRISEQNIATILDSVEDVYRKHRRHDVTATLTGLIIEGISSHSSLLDSYVVLYAAFVSSLHKVVGIEFAAYFVQNTIAAYESYYKSFQETSDAEQAQDDKAEQGKECSNVIVLVSELYNFQVISSLLVFDIIRQLLSEKLTEYNVELLLKIMRNSGQQLRQDDPSALKDIIQIVQSKISDEDNTLTSRTHFMIETLTNLKNNKLKRNIMQNQGGDAVERMKKFLSGLSKKRHVLAHEPLRVSLEDLHLAESKGKWWLVGAAWGGDPLVDRQQEVSSGDTKIAEDVNSNTLLNLAKKQGMNTDVRRNIFVVLMSSDDYVDACDRLSQLNLTEVQQREIIKVLLHCCGKEKSYNPYYTLVCERLCRSSHSHKITLQYFFWDFLRDLGESTVGGAELTKNIKDSDHVSDVQHVSATRLRNIAKAYAWWIAKDCSSLLIFKPVDFTILKTRSKEFLKELFVQLFISTQVTIPMIPPNWQETLTTRDRAAVEEVFKKATRIQTLAMGLVYFISEAFRSSDGLVKWASELAKEVLRDSVGI